MFELIKILFIRTIRNRVATIREASFATPRDLWSLRYVAYGYYDNDNVNVNDWIGGRFSDPLCDSHILSQNRPLIQLQSFRATSD